MVERRTESPNWRVGTNHADEIKTGSSSPGRDLAVCTASRTGHRTSEKRRDGIFDLGAEKDRRSPRPRCFADVAEDEHLAKTERLAVVSGDSPLTPRSEQGMVDNVPGSWARVKTSRCLPVKLMKSKGGPTGPRMQKAQQRFPQGRAWISPVEKLGGDLRHHGANVRSIEDDPFCLFQVNSARAIGKRR